MSNPDDLLTRRGLLGRALSAVALVSAIEAGGQLTAQASGAPPRIRDAFDFDWKFFKGDAPNAEEPAFADAGWRSLDLPHDWSVEGPFGQNEPSGYISFAFDATPHLNLTGENVVAVKVDNSRQPASRWYSGSGIYRHTWLTAVNPVHVAQWGTFVTTPRVSKESAAVQVKTRVRNEGASAAACSLSTAIVDKDGKTVQTAEASQQIGANGEYEFVQQLTLDKPSLWSVAEPAMYTLRSTVRVGQTTADEYETPFGVREALFDAEKGFLLNGERVKLNGVCLHHDGGSMGAAVPERVWERRLEVLKTMGCNAIRTSHNPPAPEFLDLCDRMGFCVMNEVFDEWKAGKPQVRGNGYSLYYDEWHQRDVTDFVRRDRNHPSVALWSCGNEIGDQLTPNGIALLRDLLNIFHREDPTRLVTVGCDQIAADPRPAPVEFLSLLDVVGYNYADRWRVRKELYYSVDKAVHPNWRMIGTESSGMGGIRGDYRATFPVPAAQAPPASLRNRGGRGLDTQQLWRFVRTHDYVAGDFMWTGIDYLGESSWPSHGSSAGCIDSCGFPKDGYYFYQSQWTEKPVLHLFPHWNWKEREGQFLSITCFTNCDSVELFLNGKPVGVKGYAFSMRSHASACRAATGRPARKPAQPRAPPTTCTWPGTCRTSLAL